ncbi:MAG: amino acid permease [Verrucomicrobia bacterium]|nr:amino acid permease [Verrucomicrobiota bacterium]
MPTATQKKQTNGATTASGRFGTFGGVFTPCTLTILGVIMFLRLGQVMGNTGLWRGLGIILMAKAITLLTALSLSAVATNTRVKGGGAYYLISRSLGVEFGGAIGVVFYLAQAISVSMYVVGFTEAFVGVFPSLSDSFRDVALLTNGLVFACVFIGAGWTIRLQYGILAVLALALISFVAGVLPHVSMATLTANMAPDYAPGANLFVMFALFFPAVTGIMAGANLSGDLKAPDRSIPVGTLAAIAVTGAIYIGLALLLSSAFTQAELKADLLIMKSGALVPVLIVGGVFAATLSSALGSMMGAPRILQALARDNVFSMLRGFAKGSGVDGEPRRAILMTFVIATIAILLGDLDTIAPIITLAFLITYGMLNLATFYEGRAGNPSFRPQFKYFHWSMSLLGAVGCLVVMVLLAPISAVVSVLLMWLLFVAISKREIEAHWGDVRSGVLFERARRSLLRLEAQRYHPKNWRPTMLALMGAGGHRAHLAVFGHWLTAGHGLLTLGQVIPGNIREQLERRANQEQILRDFIRKEELQAFPAVTVMPDLATGVASLVQTHGLGGLRPNTVLVGWPKTAERIADFGDTLRVISGLRRSLVAVRCATDIHDAWFVPLGTVDVWWRGESNGSLMLLLAHMLVQDPQWRGKTIRLLRVVPNEKGRTEVFNHLNKLIETSRISAISHVVVSDDVDEAIQMASGKAAVVLFGCTTPDAGDDEAFYSRTEQIAGKLRRVLFVHSAGGMTLET